MCALVTGVQTCALPILLFGGVMWLLPVFASDILRVGPDGLGLMRAMPAVGSLLVGLALTQIASPRHMGPAFFVALAVFGLSIVVFSLSETFWLSLLALGVYGGADMVSVYIRSEEHTSELQSLMRISYAVFCLKKKKTTTTSTTPSPHTT